MAKIMPASSAPMTERTPQVTTMASQTMPTSALNDSGSAVPTTVAYSPPPRPATKALTPKSTSLARTMLMPVVVDAGSLERMAANTRPDVARLRFTIAERRRWRTPPPRSRTSPAGR